MYKSIKFLILIGFLFKFNFCKNTLIVDPPDPQILGKIKYINKLNYPIYLIDNPQTRGEILEKRIAGSSAHLIGIGDSTEEPIYKPNINDTIYGFSTINETTIYFGKNKRLRLWDKSNFKNKDTVNFKYKSIHNIYNYNKINEVNYTYTFTEKDYLLADTIIN